MGRLRGCDKWSVTSVSQDQQSVSELAPTYFVRGECAPSARRRGASSECASHLHRCFVPSGLAASDQRSIKIFLCERLGRNVAVR